LLSLSRIWAQVLRSAKSHVLVNLFFGCHSQVLRSLSLSLSLSHTHTHTHTQGLRSRYICVLQCAKYTFDVCWRLLTSAGTTQPVYLYTYDVPSIQSRGGLLAGGFTSTKLLAY
jgi:hypothetical protein